MNEAHRVKVTVHSSANQRRSHQKILSACRSTAYTTEAILTNVFFLFLSVNQALVGRVTVRAICT